MVSPALGNAYGNENFQERVMGSTAHENDNPFSGAGDPSSTPGNLLTRAGHGATMSCVFLDRAVISPPPKKWVALINVFCSIDRYFLFIFQKYTIVSKFSKSDHQPSWRTVAVMPHDGCRTNHRVPWQLHAWLH
jgi:hypothetical protein